MVWTGYQQILAVLLVVTGSFNTLSVKYADEQHAAGQDGEVRPFNHPYMQSSFMFFGEFLCFVVFKLVYCYYKRKMDGSEDNNQLTKGTRNFNPFIFFIPAACDMCATTMMYIGLNFTYASSFQMFRGSVIIFTGALSWIFLRRRLVLRQWTGIIFVLAGLVLVGVSDFLTLNEEHKGNVKHAMIGDALIICAQVVTATQMVVEEKFVSGQDIPPLQAVGWEGIFGFVFICLLMIPMNFIHVPPPYADNSQGTLEASWDALVQIYNNGYLVMAVIGIMLSIAFFNFAGISITKELSATTRMILDSVRTIVIWAVSLAVKWQQFHYLQLVGFSILLLGMSYYNDVLIPHLMLKVWDFVSCGRGRRREAEDQQRVVET